MLYFILFFICIFAEEIVLIIMLNRPILVVDDEEVNCFLLKTNLELEGFEVVTALSAEEAMKLPLSNYSLILLDVMMGEMSGFDFARYLRSNPTTVNIPIIFCTAKDDEEAVLMGYEYKADDYVRKPFSMKEMVLRVKSVLRRSYMEVGIINFDTLQLDTIKKRCYIDGKELILTKTEFELLILLITNPGVYFSRDEILDKVWQHDGIVLDRTVDVNINRLRRKLGQYEKYIITKFGLGYGFDENI